jgi:tetratricopeptide (TPR) repeat protein
MQSGPVQLEVEGLLATADSQQSKGQIAQALATLRRAQGSAQAGGGPGLTAQVLVAIARVQAAADQGGDAITAMQGASELFSHAGDPASQIRALIQVASLRAAAGEFDAAKSLVRDCFNSASQIGDNQLIAEARLAAGQLLLNTRYAAAAADELRAGLAVATQLQDATAQVQLRAFLAVAVFYCGKAAEAVSLLTDDAKVAQAMADGIAGGIGLATVSDALATIQRPRDAVVVGRQAVARLKSTGAQPLIIQATIGLANLYALLGQSAEAAQCTSQAVAAANQFGGPAAVANVLLQLGAKAMQRGDQVAARDLLRQARSQTKAAGLPEPPMLAKMIGQLG